MYFENKSRIECILREDFEVFEKESKSDWRISHQKRHRETRAANANSRKPNCITALSSRNVMQNHASRMQTSEKTFETCLSIETQTTLRSKRNRYKLPSRIAKQIRFQTKKPSKNAKNWEHRRENIAFRRLFLHRTQMPRKSDVRWRSGQVRSVVLTWGANLRITDRTGQVRVRCTSA